MSATAHNAHRLLSPQQLAHVVDVVEPGGLGDPFEGLSIDQREALAELRRSGFPCGGEPAIALAMAHLIWVNHVVQYLAAAPEYFEAFWDRTRI